MQYSLYILLVSGDPILEQEGGNSVIKGVNRKVIEINRPDSAYFERAVLYLRPDVNEVPLHETQLTAAAFFSPPERKRERLRGLLWFLLGAAVSAAVWWGISLLRW